MNPTRAAATVALVVTLIAAGYLFNTFYQDKFELKFQIEALDCANCVGAKETAVAQWNYDQSKIDLPPSTMTS